MRINTINEDYDCHRYVTIIISPSTGCDRLRQSQLPHVTQLNEAKIGMILLKCTMMMLNEVKSIYFATNGFSALSILYCTVIDQVTSSLVYH